jgi:ribose transport system permease protein
VRKAAGLLGLILALSLLAFAIELSRNGSSTFFSLSNWKNLSPWIGLFGILSLGQAIVIITGGIDLSIGSVVALVSVTAAMLTDRGNGLHPAVVVTLCLGMCALIGAGNGLLITKMRLQPFIVTLCGLFIYRGITRFVAADSSQGFGSYTGLRWFGRGTMLDLFPALKVADMGPVARVLGAMAAPFGCMLLLALALTLYLHLSAQGRHLFALGANEEAARFSGLRTDRLKLTAYILCSMIAGFGGILFAFKINSIGPSDFGNFYELYAIAGAVLGGCSLRGGTGNILGVVLGISLLMVLRNIVNLLSIRSELEYVVIGGAILVGVCVDELLMRRQAPARA